MEGFLAKQANNLDILYRNSISPPCALQLNVLPWFVFQHVTERSWMLHLLVDGMKDSTDYYLYKRRHVIELALSYHDSPISDHHSQVRTRHVGLHQIQHGFYTKDAFNGTNFANIHLLSKVIVPKETIVLRLQESGTVIYLSTWL